MYKPHFELHLVSGLRHKADQSPSLHNDLQLFYSHIFERLMRFLFLAPLVVRILERKK